MAELKTKKTEQSVDSFLKQIPEARKQEDAFTILNLMEATTSSKAKMWGTAIIGFGDKRIKYENGKELDWFIMGFSPRKQNFALYITGTVKNQQALLAKLGRHKTGKGCLYLDKLSDVDLNVLKEILRKGME